jgi:ubiquinone/menaquinone biosynthesis C-methylase UbiE
MADFEGWYRLLGGGASAYARALTAARGADASIAQQGFLPGAEIVALGEAAGATTGTNVLDACCGLGGPAAVLAEHLGAGVVGVDLAPAALRQAGRRPGLAGRCAAADVTYLPFPASVFDAVVIFDSLVSIAPKAALAGEVARVLRPGGRFACTNVFGAPLTAAERARLPNGAQANVVPVERVLRLLCEAQLVPLTVRDCSAAAARTAARMSAAFARYERELADELSLDQARDLLATARFWADLLACRRVAALAIVAERPAVLATAPRYVRQAPRARRAPVAAASSF